MHSQNTITKKDTTQTFPNESQIEPVGQNVLHMPAYNV